MIGEQVGSYRIVRQLGQGGMGMVYEAEHQKLGSRAVIKVLKRELCDDADVLERFFNEARAASKIRHPGIVQVFDVGTHVHSAYIVMELLEGETLGQRLERRRLVPRAAGVLARQVASALNAAHKHGIVHRDLKPDNLFMVSDPDVPEGERVKVLDFGIAKLATPSRATKSGEVFGTPYYMSPEQCRSAAEVDARSDIYALGCILYESVCGQRPFGGGTIAQLVTAHLFESPPPPSSIVPDLSPALEQIIMRALAKEPGKRQQSMADLASELDAFTGQRALTPQPFTAVAVAADTRPSAESKISMSTTLGRSAGQLLVGQRRTRQLWLAGIALGLLSIGVVAFVVFGRAGTKPQEKATPSVAAPRADAAPAPVAEPADAAVVVETSPVAVDAGIVTPPKHKKKRGGDHAGSAVHFDRND